MTVTASDVTNVVAAAVAALSAAPADADWSVAAGPLTWDCWETVEHTADDLFTYAAQMGAGGSAEYVPFENAARHPDGARNAIRADAAAGPNGLLMVLSATGALLASMVATAAPGTRANHVFGFADPEASAAMGVLEVLVHAHDVASGLGLPWAPDPGLCARVLARLMPDVERTGDAWADLLWATGRGELPGRPRRTSWRWYNEPPAPDDGG